MARAAAGARGCRGRGGGGGGAAAEAGGRGPGGAPPAGRCWGPQSSGANISCKPEVSTKFRESFYNIRKCMSTKLDIITDWGFDNSQYIVKLSQIVNMFH